MSDYRLIREIGRGGMGSVWYGVRDDGTECAIKCMHAKYVSIPDYRDFFDSEAMAMKQLNHPDVVKIMGDTFTDPKGNLYLPMEYVKGETIEQHIKNCSTPYTEQEAIKIMSNILDAFAYIHQQGQIHRDIKPSNIMLRPDGSICVIDFGIAKDMKTSTGKTVGRQVGTHGYMSPEQISALNIDHRTDIYSLGCLLFYMLTAHHAITKRSNDYETMYAIQKEEFPSVRTFAPNVSQRMENIIFKATDKDMRKRYQSAQEFKDALLNNVNITKEIKKTHKLLPLSTLQQMRGHWRITVGRTNQDIVIPSHYVSSHHLDIDLIAEYTTGGVPPYISHVITITDHSTNGTGINGRFLHNSTDTIPFDIFAAYTQQLPEILLSGREDCQLKWDEVCLALKEKMSQEIDTDTPIENEVNEPSIELSEETIPNHKNYNGIVVVSFLFPLIGWIVYAINKNDDSIKAQKACKAAWWGFGIGILVNFLRILINT